MRPAGAAPDAREIIIALITIRFQVSVRKTIKEINCIVSCPCFRVVVKDDRGQSIFTRAEQPHERICFGISFRLLQYLYPCLICHEVFPLKELSVKIIIHRFEIIIRTIYNPVGKCCPGKIYSKLMPVLFLTVQWHCICELLIHYPGNS